MESRLDQVIRVVEEMFGCEANRLAPYKNVYLMSFAECACDEIKTGHIDEK
jgi:hypothetical protein